MLLASQALALTAPVAEPAAPGARVSALATVEILRAQTTRDEAGPQVLVRHRRVKALAKP